MTWSICTPAFCSGLPYEKWLISPLKKLPCKSFSSDLGIIYKAQLQFWKVKYINATNLLLNSCMP